MVKHNNQLPNPHLRKWWQRYVKTWFNQPGRKQSRRLARQEKAKAKGLRPIGTLRPAVKCPTQRYNMKTREGRGFTLEECKAAKVSRKVARSIGICVDHRRKNRCTETLGLNSTRLKAYMARLVLFQRNGKAKKGFGGIPNDTQKSELPNMKQVQIMRALPLPKSSKKVKARAITDAEKKFRAYGTLRKARRDAYNVGKKKEEDDPLAVTAK